MNGKPASASHTPKMEASVIIVGAGPVGLLIALALGRAGIDTLVLEAHHTLLPTIRAMVYMPVVLPPLKNLGILDKITAQAFLNKDGVAWRDVGGNLLGQLPLGSDDPNEFGGVMQIGQWRMNELILEELKTYPSVEVRFGQRLVDVDDQPGNDYVYLKTSSDSAQGSGTSFKARYVIGCDGANSGTRRACQVPFEGFTYQEFKMIGTDIIYDFIEQEGFTSLNFVVDEKDWAVIAYSGENEDGVATSFDRPLWRVAFIEHPDMPGEPEDYTRRAQDRVKRYMNKGDGKFKITRAEPYSMQQRVAAQPRKGRVMFAGDALHSNNPIGGLGLTGGILDAYCYGNALVRVLKDKEPDQLLTTCAESRRRAWIEVTDKLSQDNMSRLYATDPEMVTKRETFFEKLTDPKFRVAAAKMQRELLRNMIAEDFQR